MIYILNVTHEWKAIFEPLVNMPFGGETVCSVFYKDQLFDDCVYFVYNVYNLYLKKKKNCMPNDNVNRSKCTSKNQNYPIN